MRKHFLILGLSASLFFIAGCSNDLSPGNIVQVGNSSVSKPQFNHWLGIATRQEPGLSDCPSPDEDRCAKLQAKLKQETLNFLISSLWIEAEAKKQGVNPGQGEVDRFFDEQLKQSFKNQRQLLDFQRETGLTRSDMRFRSRVNYLSRALLKKRAAGLQPPTREEVAEYYTDNISRFTRAESRRMLLLRFSSKAGALKAQKALASGEAPQRIAERYSASFSPRPTLLARNGTADSQLEDAVFASPRGSWQGPLEVAGQYLVFRVNSESPPVRQGLREATPLIKRLVLAEKRREALRSLLSDLQSTWQPRTVCAKDYKTNYCA